MHGVTQVFRHDKKICVVKSVRFEEKKLNSVRFKNSLKKVLKLKPDSTWRRHGLGRRPQTKPAHLFHGKHEISTPLVVPSTCVSAVAMARFIRIAQKITKLIQQDVKQD